MSVIFFFFQAEDGIRDLVRSRGLGDVYKRQGLYYDRLGLALFDDEDRFSFGCADDGLWRHDESLGDFPQAECHFGKGTGPERMVCVGQIDLYEQAARRGIKRQGGAGDDTAERPVGQLRDLHGLSLIHI